VDQQLSQNSWDYTWKRMMTLIESSMASKEEDKKQKTILKQPEASIPSIPVYLDLEKKRSNGSNGNGMSRGAQPFDYLIVGAGFAGSVLAERLAAGSGKKVLIIDRRPHIAGNAYDYHNAEGILIHKYGPHIFHTNSHEVFNYLSRFTEWRQYQHRVLASVDGQLLPLPINLDTINRLYGLNLSAFELKDFFQKVAEPREKIATSEDVVISKVGRELYEKFFKNYTRKQWDLDPSELDASVTSRVPIRYNRDDRYFSDIYQAMPALGYTRLFEQLLDHPNIKIMLNTDYEEIIDMISCREVIFTGPVDEYFGFVYGKLPYRSLDFQFQTLNEEQHQPVAVINYPNEYPYTRVTEFKHLTGQKHSKTTLVYEYPTANGDPYYPIPRAENAQLYARYQALAAQKRGVYFAGRLATYKYYNMDQVVAQALTLYSKIQGLERTKATGEYTLHYVPVKLPETGQKGSSSLGV
jgi:UDP-galactopyranose mutase